MAQANDVLACNLDFDEEQDDFNLDELEEKLGSQLEEKFADLEFLKEEKEKIGNPDALGGVILDEVWKQFANQIGLDMTNETLNQKYDREHAGETYETVGAKVMQDQRYKDANKAMKEQQQSGNLKDEYTGKNISQNDKANLDHVVSRKELYENTRRQQAGINTEDLANKDKNLKATNESLNKSKGKKSVNEFCKEREQREKNLIAQNERAKKKIDESNKSEAEKRLAKEKADKRLRDKLDAKDDLMKKADSEARKDINRDIATGVAKNSLKESGRNALKEMAVSALFSLLKEIMNALVRFLKTKAKSFKSFLEEMKKAIKSFVKKITDFFRTGVKSAVGTSVTEIIFGPVSRTIKKLASLIKQGVSSVMDAIRYLRDKENKNKPLAIKIAQVGKIIMVGLTGVGALALGEVIEKGLLIIPGVGQTIFAFELPLLGSLANILGIFLGALVAGIIGAIVINLIDRFIAKKQKQELQIAEIQKGNEILHIQAQQKERSIAVLERDKAAAQSNILNRHKDASVIMKESLTNIMEDFANSPPAASMRVIDEKEAETNRAIGAARNDLDNLLNAL
ncbi:hypothetical protein HMPREF1221_01266 [Treponema socranskii subsp. paredis ATCC 35535]|nr:hypothetical protein HMPREF1221_01266 [Treponema socranskii subsp. paredis ATCC 35535]